MGYTLCRILKWRTLNLVPLQALMASLKYRSISMPHMRFQKLMPQTGVFLLFIMMFLISLLHFKNCFSHVAYVTLYVSFIRVSDNRGIYHWIFPFSFHCICYCLVIKLNSCIFSNSISNILYNSPCVARYHYVIRIWVQLWSKEGLNFVPHLSIIEERLFFLCHFHLQDYPLCYSCPNIASF